MSSLPLFFLFFSESAGSRGAQWWVAFEILEYETVNPRLRYFRTYTCTYVYMSTYEKHRVTLNYSHVSLVSLGVRITAPRHTELSHLLFVPWCCHFWCESPLLYFPSLLFVCLFHWLSIRRHAFLPFHPVTSSCQHLRKISLAFRFDRLNFLYFSFLFFPLNRDKRWASLQFSWWWKEYHLTTFRQLMLCVVFFLLFLPPPYLCVAVGVYLYFLRFVLLPLFTWFQTGVGRNVVAMHGRVGRGKRLFWWWSGIFSWTWVGNLFRFLVSC